MAKPDRKPARPPTFLPQSRAGRILYLLMVVVLVAITAQRYYRRHLRFSLFDAAAQGDTARIRSLLARGVNPNVAYAEFAPDADPNFTPLALALRGKRHDATRLLLDAGARVTPPNDKGRSALYEAVEQGDSIATRMLLERGADPDYQDRDGRWPPMQAAIENGHTDIARLLLQYGADPNSLGNNGMTALNAAILHLRQEIVALLLARGADVNARDAVAMAFAPLSPNGGRTPLLTAAQTGQIDIVRKLLARKADPNAVLIYRHSTQIMRWTPLIMAQQQPNESTRKALIALLKQAGAKEQGEAVWDRQASFRSRRNAQ